MFRSGLLFVVYGSLLSLRIVVACGGDAIKSATSSQCVVCSGLDAMPTGDAASTGDSAAPSSCPVKEPTAGERCSSSGLSCGYGSSPRPSCRDAWTCTLGTWSGISSSCAQLPAGYCPVSAPTSTTPCTPMADPSSRGDCTYSGDVLCGCPCVSVSLDGSTTAFGCAPANLVCYNPPTTPGCPSIAPNFGTPCDVQGTQCVYGNPCDVDGIAMLCRGGVWASGISTCPP